MTSVMEIVVNATDNASVVIEGIGDAGEETGRRFEVSWGTVTAATAAAGAGLEAFARSQQDSNVQIRQSAAAIGVSEDSYRDLATETSNVTFPLNEVLDLMETGRQRGLDSADALQEYAAFWDKVGDATGEVGPELGKAGAALAAVGIQAGNEAQALDAFGFITDNTTGSVGGFLQFLERAGPELREMGADVDDAAAILGVLEGELGMSGRAARTEFRSAVSEADGDMSKLLDTLGISEESFASMRGEVEGSSDVIDRNAEILADSFTPLQKAEHAVKELTLQYGGLSGAAGTLAPALIAVGPVGKGVSLAFKGISKGSVAAVKGLASVGAASGRMAASTAVATGSFVASAARMVASMTVAAARVVAGWVLMAVQSLIQAARMAISWIIAMGPIGLIIAAIVAIVAIIVLNWDKIVEFTKKAFTFVWEFLKGLWEDIRAFIGGAINKIKEIFFRFHPLGIIIKNWGKITGWITDQWNNVTGRVRSAVDKIRGFISGIWDGVTNGLKAGLNAAIGLINTAISGVNVLIRGANRIPGVNIPEVPSIPRLHDGGVFRSPAGRGEGLALLRDRERVRTPEQEDELLALLRQIAGHGSGTGGGEFTGELRLDSGELLGIVDGRISQDKRKTNRKVDARRGAR